MKYILLHTKLNRPSVAPDILPRERLIKLLGRGLKRPLTLISAPAGYGKSTLTSRWVASGNYPWVWVSLDKDDNDLRQFLSYLLAAIEKRFPKSDLRCEIFLAADRLPPAEELARFLLNDLHQVPEPFNLVLDDYQCITNKCVHDMIGTLLKYPVQTMHLVLVTRQDPPLPLAALRGRGLINEIRTVDLRFTLGETAALFNEMFKIPLDNKTAAHLDKKIEGWAAGLRLTGLYLKDSEDAAGQVRRLSGSSLHIAEYLVSEVLERQKPDILAFLTETSILDRFCAPLYEQMCQQITSADNKPQGIEAKRIIRQLVQTNLFVIPLDNQGHWFRYHHLFQDFLKSVLRKKRTPNQIADLHRMAGNWFAENDLIEEAIRHLISAGDTQAAIQLVVDRRHGLFNTSHFVRLGRWLKLLPKNAVAETPLLATTQAFIGIELGNDTEAHLFTESAVRMLAALPPQSNVYPILKGEVSVLRGLVALLMGDAHNGIVYAQTALNTLPEHMEMMRSLGIGVLSVCHQMKGDIDHAIMVIRKNLADTTLSANMEARLHFYQCLAHYMDGDLTSTMHAARRCLQVLGNVTFHHTRTFADYFLGKVHYLQNQLDKAETCLLKVLADYHAANPSYLAHAGIILACIYLSRGDDAAVKEVIEQVSDNCRKNDHIKPLSLIRAFEVEIVLRRGDIRRANQLCKQIDFEVRPPIWFHYTPQLTPIKCMLAQGTGNSLKTAHARLLEWDKRMDGICRNNLRIEILALLALVCHKQRDEDAALQHLRTALNLAEPGGWIRTFLDLGEPMAALLKSFLECNPVQTFAQEILIACQAERRIKVSSEPGDRLTRRETEILFLLAEGLSNNEIAEKVFISHGTVKTHLKNIFKKLGVKRRMEAVKKGLGLWHNTSK